MWENTFFVYVGILAKSAGVCTRHSHHLS